MSKVCPRWPGPARAENGTYERPPRPPPRLTSGLSWIAAREQAEAEADDKFSEQNGDGTEHRSTSDLLSARHPLPWWRAA